MRRAAIVAPVRSAVGVYGGSLRPVPVEKLKANVITALMARSGLDAARLDELIIAQSYANGEAPCIGRYAVLEADLPIEIPGYQLDRRCGGGLQAVLNAAMLHELKRRQDRYALETMCVGSGQGVAAIFARA